MDNDDNDDDATITAYSTLFRSHLSAFSAHLAGNSSPSSPSSSRSSSPTQEDQHTWSRTEQDAFYHALRTHSRLRPDLIAASVRTKNVLEVCARLATLDAASRGLPASESVRDLTPAAVEVSQAWIEWEERAAERLTIRMHTTDTCAEQPEGSPDAERHAALHSLTATHLTVLDRILSASESSLPPDTSGTPDPDPAPDPNLSPRSRRRIQKRQYMRRRRAVDRGESPPPSVHAHTKLVPGRKKKPRRPPMGRPKKYKKHGVRRDELVESDLEWNSGSDKEEEGARKEESSVNDGDKGKGREARLDAADIDTDAEYAHPRHSGITAPYRLHTRLSALDIDAPWLARAEMDMFHLARLGALQRLSDSLSSSKSEPCINTAISPHTIRLLTQLLRAFTHAAIAHAITLQEHESRMKGAMRVWHTATSGEGEVGPGTVHRAVHGMGAGARWGREDGLGAWGAGEEGEEGETEGEEKGEVEEKEEGEDDQGMERNGEGEEDIEMQDYEYDDDDLASLDYTPPRFRPEYDLHAPLVVLPLIYRTAMAEGEHNSSEFSDEDKDDEGEGGNESDDATLDAEDGRRARAHERALWAAVAQGGAREDAIA